jgi:hypothetical protein
MAPTINKTKLVATTMATFVSTDKFIIFPSITAAIPMTPFLNFPFVVGHFEFQPSDGRRTQVRSKK